MKDVFTTIYKTGRWLTRNKETVSGNGSTMHATEAIRVALPWIIRKYGITSIYDAACGDFNWMSRVNLRGVRYTGGDVVRELIIANRRNYPTHNFIVADIATHDLPDADLYICRDVFVHMSNEDIKRSMANIRGKYKYLLVTTFPSVQDNADIQTGMWRPVNVERPPFGLGEPLMLIDERHMGIDKRDYSKHKKMMGLYQ